MGGRWSRMRRPAAISRFVNVKRFNSSTCIQKFQPLCENYKTLRHIHFPGITLFAAGQKVQETMVNANLDFKKMEAKIKKQKHDLEARGFSLPEYEDQLLHKILDMKPFPTVLTFEFENVYTGGKKLKKDEELMSKVAAFEKAGCKFYQLERGGQVTWHGEGQMVAYVILDLKQFLNLSVKCFVESVLLAAIQDTLSHRYGLASFVNDNPGVWMSQNDDKIASVGCNVRRAITSYGIALNLDPNLQFLNQFTMCGLPGTVATSIKEMRPDVQDSVEDVGFHFAKEVARRLSVPKVEHMSGENLQV